MDREIKKLKRSRIPIIKLVVFWLRKSDCIEYDEFEDGRLVIVEQPVQYTRLRYQSLTENKGKPSHEGELDTQPLVQSTYADVRAFLLSDDEAQANEEDILGAGEEMDKEPQAASIVEAHHQSPPPQAEKPQSSHALSTEASEIKSSWDDLVWKYDNTLPLIEHQLVKDQTDKLVEASTSSLEKSSNTISDLYKGFNIITELLKEIKNVIKDDPVINNKISEATESFTKISKNITKVLSIVKGFNFYDLQSYVNALLAHALKQDEELAAWAKSSTNMAWNLGFRLSGLEQAQNHIQSSMSSLKEDTHSIKTMMTEMYEVFKGQSLGNVTLTLALTHIPANFKGKNDTNTVTEDPPSYTDFNIFEYV
nr:hypothetical protein [Tanacetum cinerariifolium]